MTPLRQRMIEDLQLKGLSQSTQTLYVIAVRQLCEHFGKTPGRILQRAGSACKKEFINEGLVIPGQESELVGERKGSHEVLDWKQLFLLAIQPQRGFMVLALWAAAMPT